MLHLHLVEQPSAPIRSLSTAREWRTGWRPGKRPSHPQLMRTILWNKSYCWLLCNLPLQSAIKLLLCFFCSSSAFLRHAISSRKQNCCSAPSMREAWLSSWGAWGRPRRFLQKKKLNFNITCLQFTCADADPRPVDDDDEDDNDDASFLISDPCDSIYQLGVAIGTPIGKKHSNMIYLGSVTSPLGVHNAKVCEWKQTNSIDALLMRKNATKKNISANNQKLCIASLVWQNEWVTQSWLVGLSLIESDGDFAAGHRELLTPNPPAGNHPNHPDQHWGDDPDNHNHQEEDYSNHPYNLTSSYPYRVVMIILSIFVISIIIIQIILVCVEWS